MIYTFKNIKAFAANDRLLFILYVICQMTVIHVILLSYGTVQNFKIVKDEGNKPLAFEIAFGNNVEEYYSKETNDFQCIGDESVDNKSVKKFLSSIDENTLDSVKEIFYTASCQDAVINNDNDDIIDAEVVFYLEYTKDDNQFYPYFEAYENTPVIGTIMSESEYATGIKQAVLPMGYPETEIGNTLDLNGIEYEIIGIQLNDYSVIIPFNGAPDDLNEIYSISFTFDSSISNEDYESIKNAAIEVYGDKAYVPAINTLSDNMPFYNSIVVVSLLLAVIASITLMILYRYIIEKRRRSLAIYRLNGCTKVQIISMLISEIFLIITICTSISVWIYFKITLKQLSLIYTYIKMVYTKQNIFLLLFIELSSVIIINFLMIEFELKKDPIKDIGRWD